MANRQSISIERMRAINCVKMVLSSELYFPVDYGADVRMVEYMGNMALMVRLVSPGYFYQALYLGVGPLIATVYTYDKLIRGDCAGRRYWISSFDLERKTEQDEWKIIRTIRRDVTPEFKKLFRIQ